MSGIGPILPVPRLRFQNVGDGIYAPNASRFCLCGLDDPCPAVRPRNDLGRFRVRQSHDDPGIAWSNHHVLRFGVEPGHRKATQGHHFATPKLVGWSFRHDQPIISEAIPSGSAVGGPTIERLQQRRCATAAPPPPPTVPSDCLVAAITVQIPYELSLASPNIGDAAAPAAEVVITANGVTSKAFTIHPVTDNLHVIKTCDAFPPKQVDASQVTVSLGCNAAVKHADGTLVTADAPGKAGEVLVIYTFGLGQTTPAVKTGSATPTPAPVLGPASRLGSVRTLELQYDFRPNAEPSRPFNVLTGVISTTPPTAPVILLAPVFVGLTPEQVGLYQINVQLPSAFPAVVLPCTTLAVGTGNLAYPPAFVQSNLPIDIGGVTSFDGAAICIQPGQ